MLIAEHKLCFPNSLALKQNLV